eukprot:2766282-Pyramimonas_sp.AAC.1
MSGARPWRWSRSVRVSSDSSSGGACSEGSDSEAATEATTALSFCSAGDAKSYDAKQVPSLSPTRVDS